MATQMQLARKGIITEAMKQVAAYEGVKEEFIRKGVAEGTAWEDVPEDWVCPLCGVGKDQFSEQ